MKYRFIRAGVFRNSCKRNALRSSSSDTVSKSSTTSSIGISFSCPIRLLESKPLGTSSAPYNADQIARVSWSKLLKSAGRSLIIPSTYSVCFALTQQTAIRFSLDPSRISRQIYGPRRSSRTTITPDEYLRAIRRQPSRQVIKFSRSSYELVVNLIAGRRRPSKEVPHGDPPEVNESTMSPNFSDSFEPSAERTSRQLPAIRMRSLFSST